MKRNRRGATAVEFAVTLPLFFLILAGIVDLGVYYLTQARVAHALHRGGAVAASVLTEPGVSDGEAIKALGILKTQEALNNSGVWCDADCAVTGSIWQTPEWGVEVVEFSVSLPFTPVVGLISMPEQIERTYVIGLREQ